MNDEARARVAGRTHERVLLLAGLVGLAATAFTACGSSSSDDSASAGATASGGSAGTAGTATSSAGNETSGGSSANAGATSVDCTASADTAANAASVVAAANALYAKLTTAQQAVIQLDYSLANAEQWSNLPTTAIPRNGVMIGDMSADAQTAAVALVSVAAGSAGNTLFSELRAADEWLVTDGKADSSSYGDGRYYFAFVGTPSTSAPWLLQIAGHHLAYNFTYNGACTSATPLFDGVEPTSWTGSDNTAHAPLEAQRTASVAVIAAIAGSADSLLSGTFTDIVNGPTNSNGKGDTRYFTGLTYPTGTSDRGVLVGSLGTDAQALVKTAIEAWVNNAADATAKALLAEYESDSALAQTYVAYSGAQDLTTKNSYFRIDGPRVWIEYTIQGGIVYQDRVHFHTIWRDKASDYGAEFAGAEGTTDTSTTGTGMTGGPPDGGNGGPPGN